MTTYRNCRLLLVSSAPNLPRLVKDRHKSIIHVYIPCLLGWKWRPVSTRGPSGWRSCLNQRREGVSSKTPLSVRRAAPTGSAVSIGSRQILISPATMTVFPSPNKFLIRSSRTTRNFARNTSRSIVVTAGQYTEMNTNHSSSTITARPSLSKSSASDCDRDVG